MFTSSLSKKGGVPGVAELACADKRFDNNPGDYVERAFWFVLFVLRGCRFDGPRFVTCGHSKHVLGRSSGYMKTVPVFFDIRCRARRKVANMSA